MSIIINHVMSSDIASGIFSDLLNYYKKYCHEDIKIIETSQPIDNADIYHYHRPHLEKKLKENSVVTVHHDLNDVDKWLHYDKFHERYVESKTVFCLNTTQQSILSDNGIKHTELIPHGYNTEIFHDVAEPKIISGKINIGILSKRYGRKVKGEAYLLELFKRLDSDRYKFTVVGEDRSITAYKAEEFGFETLCFERLPYFCYGDLYRQLNFLLVTSLYEGGPANIPEAISSATPIISNPIGMSNDYIKNGINGIILTGDVDSDATAIDYFSTNENYEIMSKNAWGTRRNILSWQEVMNKTSYLYKNLIKEL